MPPRQTVSLQHFEQLYARGADPWRYASSAYERGKYAATLAALPSLRYRRALDVGCSIGVLTEQLATRCDNLLALEPVETARTEAVRRNAHHPHVRFAATFIPRDWPSGRFDLILISEVLDYLSEPDLTALAERLAAALEPDADLLLVHWVGKKGARSDGAEASDLLIRALGDRTALLRADRTRDYRLDVLRRRGSGAP